MRAVKVKFSSPEADLEGLFWADRGPGWYRGRCRWRNLLHEPQKAPTLRSQSSRSYTLV